MTSDFLKLFRIALYFSAFFALLCNTSCKKEVTPEESPFFWLFDQPNIKVDTTVKASSNWIYGFRFSPLKNGKINQLGIKLPVKGSFKVRLWDLSNNTVLREQLVISTTANEPAFANIDELAVKNNAVLGLSVFADAFLRVQKTDGSNFSFPVEIGNIKILSFNEKNMASSSDPFPSELNISRVAPCVNVIFVED